MGAGYADAVLVQAAHIAQQHAALNGGDAVGLRCAQLHIVLCNGCRIDHHVAADHVVGLVAQGHLDPHLPLGPDDGAIQHVAAGDLVALGRQDLDQRIHPAAAAADKVELVYMIQQMLVIIGKHEHNRHNLHQKTAGRAGGPQHNNQDASIIYCLTHKINTSATFFAKNRP